MFHNVRDAAGKFARKDGAPSVPGKRKMKKPAPVVADAVVVNTPAVDVGTTLVAFVLDASTSMRHLAEDVIAGFNSTLGAMKAGFAGQDCIAMVQSFGDRTNVIQHPTPLNNVQPLRSFPIYGNTALFQSVNEAVNSLLAVKAKGKTAFLIVTMTDGEENGSYGLDIPGFMRACVDRQNSGQWTFTYQVPRGGKSYLLRFGVPEGNIREWEQTRTGAQEAFKSAAVATQSYAAARSLGHTQVASFYVTTDLSKVTKADLAKLTDVGARFKSCTVDKEADIAAFVQRKTKSPYVIGQAYYQLMKKEKVQPQKAVLIKEKTGSAIYGGSEARGLLGLPTGVDATVTPGNHANFDIFVQSTSVNRKLPRGTAVLVDTTHYTNLPSTW